MSQLELEVQETVKRLENLGMFDTVDRVMATYREELLIEKMSAQVDAFFGRAGIDTKHS